MLEEEVDALLCAAFDLCFAVFRWSEGAAVTTLDHLNAIDIDATARQLAGEFKGVSGQDAFDIGAGTLRALGGIGFWGVCGLDLAAEDSHGGSFAERNRRCTLC